MFQIARNARIDYLRKYSREETLDEEEAAEELVSPDPTPGEQVEQTQELRYVRKALKRLSMDKREVLLLARFHDLRYEEIAGIMNCSVATVKTRVFRAMQDLRENFNQLTGEKTL
jgi:RNA polymerase sigma-70 factor (ECF subfamily)